MLSSALHGSPCQSNAVHAHPWQSMGIDHDGGGGNGNGNGNANGNGKAGSLLISK